MQATLKQVQGLSFVAKGDSNHWVAMDGKKIVGGSEAGTSPMELMLMSLGGCSSMDVVSLLRKKRADLRDFEVKVSADRAEKHPKVFTKIYMKFIFTGKDLKKEDIEEAINLSQEKFCSAAAMLSKAAPIETEYEIEQVD